MNVLSTALVALSLAALCSTVDSRFVVEQGGIKVKFPASARSKYPKGFDTSLANFGSPKYGGSIVGSLVYVDESYGEDFECKPIPCNYGCQPFSEAKPPFTLDKQTQYIMLIDRGPEEPGMKPCKFAQKVWNAQQAGAVGAIVVNYEDRRTTMEAPNDEDDSLKYLRNITIPAAFVTRTDGDALKALIKPTRSDKHPRVMISLDWTDLLPRSEIVHWEFWSNANDMCGPVCDVQKSFIKEFAPVAKDFQENKWVQFTPHYLVWVCPDSYHKSDECKSQCIRQGRYCTPDPDGDLDKGYSGADIVQENLRQLCVFRLANESGKPWLWWDYIVRFGEECSMHDRTYNQDCAEKIFKEIGGEDWSNMGALRRCIGDIDEDKPSDILDREMAGQRGDSDEGEVYILPTIRINEGQYRGKLSYTEVLRALCAGFNKNDEPAACNKVGEADCRVGAPGDVDCKNRKDGKTVCKDTFAGYVCTCGSGFISHPDPKNGSEVCLDINECLSTDMSTLEPECTCDRCACQNVFGGYMCIADLKDECATNHGGCWNKDYYVGSKKTHFSACQDNIKKIQDAAAHGKDIAKMPLHECACPKCFSQSTDLRGRVTCEPACDLDKCDLVTGACSGGGGGGSGRAPAWSILLSVVVAVAVVAAAGYGLYQFRLRSAMHQEVRAIMAQYMPLQEAEGPPTSNGV
jgi:hypothetical protein